MRILIVDANLVFAKKVGSFLEEHLRSAEIHYASNVPVLRRRLNTHHYDYIIADIFAAFDADSMQEALKDVQIPMLVWSVLDRPSDLTETFRTKLSKQIMRKPSDDSELEEVVTSVSSVMNPA